MDMLHLMAMVQMMSQAVKSGRKKYRNCSAMCSCRIQQLITAF
jgi:hypothetical protein